MGNRAEPDRPAPDDLLGVRGTPYGAVHRLCGVAAARWAELDAEYARPGQELDLLDLRFDRFLNVVYTWALNRVSYDKLEDWLSTLNSPVFNHISAEERRRLAEEEMAIFADAQEKLG